MKNRNIDVEDWFESRVPSAQSFLIKANASNKLHWYIYSYHVKSNLKGRSVWAHIKDSSLNTRFVDTLDVLEAILIAVMFIPLMLGKILSAIVGVFLNRVAMERLKKAALLPIQIVNRLAEIVWGLALAPVIVMIHLAINFPRWVSKACSKSLSADSIERNDNEAAELSDTELPQIELPQTEQFNQSAQDNDQPAEEGTFLFRRPSYYIGLNYA